MSTRRRKGKVEIEFFDKSFTVREPITVARPFYLPLTRKLSIKDRQAILTFLEIVIAESITFGRHEHANDLLKLLQEGK